MLAFIVRKAKPEHKHTRLHVVDKRGRFLFAMNEKTNKKFHLLETNRSLSLMKVRLRIV